MIHIMLDLETWGKYAGCDIRSIGATRFDPLLRYTPIPDGSTEIEHFHFYRATDNPMKERFGYFDGIDTYRKYNLFRDPETVNWWNEQPQEAKKPFENPIDLKDAIIEFGGWIYKQCGDSFSRVQNELRMWSNDPQFDISIIEHVMRSVGMYIPWHYRAPRSFRTVTELAGIEREEFCNYGVPHHSLHDSVAQSMTVCKAYEKLGIVK